MFRVSVISQEYESEQENTESHQRVEGKESRTTTEHHITKPNGAEHVKPVRPECHRNKVRNLRTFIIKEKGEVREIRI